MTKNGKLFTKIGTAIVGIAMAIGVGVAASSGSAREARATTSTQQGSIDLSSSSTNTGNDAWNMSGASGYYNSNNGAKLDATGEYVFKNSIFSGVVSSNMTNLSVTINAKINGTPTEANSYRVEAINSTGTAIANDTKTGAAVFGTSFGNTTFTISSGLTNCTGIRFVYANKGVGNVGVKSISWTATYTSDAPVTYSITYSANGGTGADAPETISGLENGDNSHNAAAVPGFTKYGYTLDNTKWNTQEDGQGTNYAVGSQITIDGANLVLYAVWQEDHTAPGKYIDNPYTVAQAKQAIDSGTDAQKQSVYVTGFISEIVEAYDPSKDFGNMSYNISDTGLTSGFQLQAYRGKNDGGAKFTSETAALVVPGNLVVVYGDLVKYNQTYELASDNQLKSNISGITLESVGIIGDMTTKTYYAGDEWDYSGLSLRGTFSDSETRILGTLPDLISSGALVVEAADEVATFGENSVILSGRYNNALDADPVEITGLTINQQEVLVSVYIDGDMTNKAYQNDDDWDFTGLSLKGVYSGSRPDENLGALSTLLSGSSFVCDLSDPQPTMGHTSLTISNIAYSHNEEILTGDDKVINGIEVSLAPRQESFDLTKQPSTMSESALTWTSEFITIRNDKAASAQNANNYCPGNGDDPARTSTRFYSGQIVSITPAAGVILGSIVFTATTEGYATALNNSTWQNASHNASTTTVTVTPTNGESAISITVGATCGFSGIVVNYYVASLDSVAVAFNDDPADRTFTAGSKFAFNGTLTASYEGNVPEPKDVKSSAVFYLGTSESDIDNEHLITTDTVLTHDDNGKHVYVAYTENGTTVHDDFVLIVNYKPVTSVNITKSVDTNTLAKGEQIVLTASYTDQYAQQGQTISWETSASSILSISADTGNSITVTASNENVGSATITASVGGKQATVTITVSDDPDVRLDNISLAAFTGDQAGSLSVSQALNFPNDAVLTYAWSCAPEGVITVSNESVATTAVNYVSAGTTTVTVTVTDQYQHSGQASCAVTVTQSAETLSPISSTVEDGKLYLGTANKSLTLSTTPATVGNATAGVVWSSNHEEFATVSNNGVVTAIAAGTATITATGDYATTNSQTFNVTVLTPDSIEIASLPTVTEYTKGATFNPEGLVVKAVFGEGENAVKLDAVGFELSNPDLSTAGAKVVTVSLLGKTTTFSINVLRDTYYSKVVAQSDLAAGDKLLIVAEKSDESGYMALTTESSGDYITAAAVTVNENKIAQSDLLDTYELTLGGKAGAWTLARGDEKLLGARADRKVTWGEGTEENIVFTWDITLNEDGTFAITSTNSEFGKLQYNQSSPRFVNYKTGSQTDVLLFKVGAGTTPDPEVTLSKIEVTTMPTKTTYEVGEQLDKTGLVVTATYSNQSTKTINLSDLQFSGFDSSEAGEKTVIVTYQGKETSFKVTVNAPVAPGAELQSISVKTQPTKTTYEVGETASLDGLVITATYSDGSTRDISTGFTSNLSDIDMSTAGSKTVTITYQGKTTTVTLTVNAATPVVDPVETARQNALRELQAYVANLGESNYSAENWARIQAYLQEAPEILAGLDTVERIEKYVTTFKNAMTAIPTIAEQEAAALADAKAVALAGLKEYYDSFDQSQYDEAGVAALTAAYNDGKDAIEAATTTDAIDAAVRSAKAAMDAVAKKPSAPARRCGGDIAATSIILSTIALAGAGLLVFKKRKED